MKYDVATKQLLETNPKVILQEICGIDLKQARLIDLPQEVTTIKRIDSPFFIEVKGKDRVHTSLRMANRLETRKGH